MPFKQWPVVIRRNIYSLFYSLGNARVNPISRVGNNIHFLDAGIQNLVGGYACGCRTRPEQQGACHYG